MVDIAADEIGASGVVGSRARCLGGARVGGHRAPRGAGLCRERGGADRGLLQRLPGIGPWTAQYIAMRALHWPDAFPGGDLMLLRAAKASKKELHARAEAWRPWRAYAAHYLWQSMGVYP